MRQILCTLCAVFALLCLASVAQVSAAPAPALTQVVPVALRAEETVWIPAEEAYPNRLPRARLSNINHPLPAFHDEQGTCQEIAEHRDEKDCKEEAASRPHFLRHLYSL